MSAIEHFHRTKALERLTASLEAALEALAARVAELERKLAAKEEKSEKQGTLHVPRK